MADILNSETDRPAASFDGVHTNFLNYFPQLVEELGGNVEALLIQAGLSPDRINESNFGASFRQIALLLELAASELHCPDFGMRLAMFHDEWSHYGLVGKAMLHARTYGDGVRYVAHHCYAHSLVSRVWAKPCPLDEEYLIHYEILLDHLPNRAQMAEQIMLMGQGHIGFLTGERVRPRRIHFRHLPVATPHVYRRYFGCPVAFGQSEDGIAVSEHDFNCPQVHGDEQAFRDAIACIDREITREDLSASARTRSVVMKRLATGGCSNDLVAAEMGMHRRTLLRKLQAEGNSFQKIKDEVRLDMLVYYLGRTDLELTKISEKLGFSEQSVMTRFCHQWLSGSPSDIRAQRSVGR